MISNDAGRALDLITGLDLCQPTDARFWKGVVMRIVLELDEQGHAEAVMMTRRLLTGLWDRLEAEKAAPGGEGITEGLVKEG